MALNEKRIIITLDLDFGELYRHFGVGTIVLRLRSKDNAFIMEHLIAFLEKVRERDIQIKKNLVILTEGKVRIIG